MVAVSIKKLTHELAELAASPAQLAGASAHSVLTQALSSRSAALVSEAAKLVAEHQLNGYDAALTAAYQSLALAPNEPERAGRLDPGSLAKAALLAALDAIEAMDAELFAAAAQYVQFERAKGSVRDTAEGVRARGVLALARTGHPDLLPILGACLGDNAASVRLSAARAVAHREQREGAGLLLLRLGAGDDTPEVLIECVRGLFAIAPDLGERYARRALQDASPERREQLTHALATAPNDSAIALLEAELAQRSLAQEREPIITALGLSRRPRARALLLELVGGERSSDAEAALSALAVHRYDGKLASQLGELTAHSRELSRRVRELFSS